MSEMDIGINTGGFLKAFDGIEIPARLAAIGYRALDWPLTPDWNVKNPMFDTEEYISFYRKIRAAADSAGIGIFQTHGFFPTEGQDYDWLVSNYRKQIRATAELGAKYIVVHPMIVDYRDSRREETMAANVRFFSDLLPALREYGVIACLENLWEYDRNTHYIVRTNTSTAEDLLECLSRLGNDECFGICLDFGHLQNVGCDVATAIKRVGKDLKVVHAHDNDVFSDSHTLPMFGKADWCSVVSALREIDFPGVFSMELNVYSRVGKYDRDLMWDMAAFAYKIARSLIKTEGRI